MPGGEEFDDYDNWFQQQMPGMRTSSLTFLANNIHSHIFSSIGKDPLATGITWNEWIGRPYVYDEWYHPTNYLGYGAVDFLERYHEQQIPNPWFLKVSFHRPHSPYDPPSRLLNQTTMQGFKPQALSDWDHIYRGPNSHCGPKFKSAWCGLMPSKKAISYPLSSPYR
jgi:arylsulfatase